MSEKCQQATSFDHAIGAGEQRRWHAEAERLRSLEIGYSMATVLPTTQRSSLNRCTKAAAPSGAAEGVAEPRNPTVGSLAGCSARVAIGNAAAAPPTSVMNSRLCM
jgi:hypothetical protein